MVNLTFKKGLRAKSILSKLKSQNKRFHNMVPDYLERPNLIKTRKAQKLRKAYLDKLAKMPFFSELLKDHKNKFNLGIQINEKKFEYSLLRVGIRQPSTNQVTLIIFDSKGRGELLGKVNVGKEIIWYPLHFGLETGASGLILKRSVKSLLRDENRAFFSISDQINARLNKIKFIDFENPSNYSRKLRAAREYL